MIKICFLILGFYGNKGGSSPKWKHDKYEEVVQMEEPSSTTDNWGLECALTKDEFEANELLTSVVVWNNSNYILKIKLLIKNYHT